VALFLSAGDPGFDPSRDEVSGELRRGRRQTSGDRLGERESVAAELGVEEAPVSSPDRRSEWRFDSSGEARSACLEAIKRSSTDGSVARHASIDCVYARREAVGRLSRSRELREAGVGREPGTLEPARDFGPRSGLDEVVAS